MDLPVDSVRRFNRFYTRYVGALRRDFLETPFSLAEASVLYELAQNTGLTATDLAKALSLDNGYLSRILSDFAERGMIRKVRSSQDARQSLLFLTPKGRTVFEPVDRRQHDKVVADLSALARRERERLVEAMDAVHRILSPEDDSEPRYLLRTTLQPGDIGWVIERHGVLYAQEYGWNEAFEVLVAEIASAFVRNFDPKRERVWIAERRGANAGCIFLAARSKQVAQLRLLLVEPGARGAGLGKRLVRECVDFARCARYKKIILWTNNVLHAARHLYMEAGFQLVKEEQHDTFGPPLVGQYWELPLAQSTRR